VTMVVRTAHRVALASSGVFLVLAVAFGSRYYREQGGWDFGSASDDLIITMLAVLGLVLSLSFALLRPGPRNPHGSRITSIVWSVALMLALLFTWRVIVLSHRWVEDVGTIIDSPRTLDEFIAANPEAFAPYDYFIPTGVYLQSFEFLSSSNVEMSGFVWQKYAPDIPDSIVRGAVLPEQLENAYSPVEAWRVERDGTEEIGWYFSGVFRQSFDYRLYPFDTQNIWLRLWHPEPVEGVLLVPDFAAYRDLTPSTLPGLDTKFVFGGWDPLNSYFGYDLLDYNVNFGLDDAFSTAPDPELYFNLTVVRDSLSPMLEHLVLEVVIAILVFLLLLQMADDSGKGRAGLSLFDLSVAAGGLLFAVILGHNAIRGAVQSQELTYLEWFPLILNIFIVLVVLSAVLRTKQWRVPGLGYTGDLVPVLVYWPALLGTLLAVTLRMFFFT
jgi:hypothetical protein